jgi:hypothetical protein
MGKFDAQVDDGFANALVARLDARMTTLLVGQLAELVARKIKLAQLQRAVGSFVSAIA